MSTQIKKIDVLKTALYAPSVQEQFKNALRENSDAFVASIIDLYNTDKSLQECDPNQVIREALKAATLKLPINKALGFAYIIKFINSVINKDGVKEKIPTPTFVLGYRGYVQLAMRTGYYKNINTGKVYEGELRSVSKLTGEVNFDGEKKSEKVIGYFAHFELLNGFSKTLYMDLDKMAKHAKKYSPPIKNKENITVNDLKKLAGKDNTGIGWLGGFDDMALKTVLRLLLSKYGYLSVEMQTALSGDSENEYSRDEKILFEGNSKELRIEETSFVDVTEGGSQNEDVETESVPRLAF